LASHWRIRHKLILGLGLVVAIMALQLAGTLKGLMSYRATLTAIGGKWVELAKVYSLREAANKLAEPGTRDPNEFEARIQAARTALTAYKDSLMKIVEKTHEDPYRENTQIAGIEGLFDKLETELRNEVNQPIESPGATVPLVQRSGMQEAIKRVIKACADLNDAITRGWRENDNPQARKD
jgi:hypothetical protein